MTWGPLEQQIDASDLSRRNRLVLKAFSMHVNPPSKRRPYPDNMLVWPGMESLMDFTRYSLDTVQAAKRELVQRGILELMTPASRAAGGYGRAPRYRINEQKLPRDDAAWERQIARRARRQKGTDAADLEPEKGMQNAPPFPEKGGENPDPFLEKGYAKCPPEFSSSSKDPEAFNFSRPDDGQTKKGLERSAEDVTPETPTLTPAPATFPLTDALRAWAAVHTPHVADLAYERDRWLQRCRAKHYVFLDWAEEFKSWLIEANHRARQHGSRSTSTAPAPGAIPPDAPRHVTCSFSSCDEPPCGHGPQSCRRHGWGTCHDCLAEAAAEGPRERLMAAEEESPASTDAVTVGVAAAPEALAEAVPMDDDARPEVDMDEDLQEPPRFETEAEETWPPEPCEEPDEATPAPLVAVGALLPDVLAGHAMPAAMPPPRPLGSDPPRVTTRGQRRALLAEPDQPLYEQLMAQRRARETQQAALAAEGGDLP